MHSELQPPNRLRFFATPPHRCAYLPGREAVSLFADPHAAMTPRLYGRLIDLGFRRTGSHVYRPGCRRCSACVPTRIPIGRFRPNRSQRRNLRTNRDLTVHLRPPGCLAEHFELYRRYLRHRHPGGGMDQSSPADYRDFLCCDWIDGWFAEFRLHGELLAVAVVDRLPQGLSAVYTFFAPEHEQRGLGAYAILWQIAQAQRLGLDYVYLGYWIAAHPKMSYKTRFRPIEGLVEGEWRPLPAPQPRGSD